MERMLEKIADHKKHGISLTCKKHETKDSAAKDPKVPPAGKLTCKWGGQKVCRRQVWVTLGVMRQYVEKQETSFPRLYHVCLFSSTATLKRQIAVKERGKKPIRRSSTRC